MYSLPYVCTKKSPFQYRLCILYLKCIFVFMVTITALTLHSLSEFRINIITNLYWILSVLFVLEWSLHIKSLLVLQVCNVTIVCGRTKLWLMIDSFRQNTQSSIHYKNSCFWVIHLTWKGIIHLVCLMASIELLGLIHVRE